MLAGLAISAVFSRSSLHQHRSHVIELHLLWLVEDFHSKFEGSKTICRPSLELSRGFWHVLAHDGTDNALHALPAFQNLGASQIH